MTYQPRPYLRTPIPAPATRHGLLRFTGGYTPALAAQVSAAGGFDRWFARQLSDGYDDAWYDVTSRWWTSVNASVASLWQRDRAKVELLWQADANYERWVLVRRVGSLRQVREVMTEFFEHHLHVPANGEVGPFRADYGKVLRRHAFGRYADLLVAAVTHPAMAVYLSNANSSKAAPNENLGRELLELHTVGRGSYTEEDVKTSARILTGYRVGLWSDWAFSYDPSRHWTGPVRVLGFRHPNSAPDGRAVLTAYLHHLARHPATARRIARKLAVRFVSDDPSTALVAKLAQVYLSHDTAIRPVLTALVATPEFRASAGAKVRTPSEDVVATWRALDARLPGRPSDPDSSGAGAILWQSKAIGATPFGWQRPDGRPDTAQAWSSTSRFLASLDVHYSMAGGWWPETDVTYRRASSWLPQARIRFDELLDHLARSLHGQGSTRLLLQAACEATGCRPAEAITASHPLVRWEMARLLTVLLDSPTHLRR